MVQGGLASGRAELDRIYYIRKIDRYVMLTMEGGSTPKSLNILSTSGPVYWSRHPLDGVYRKILSEALEALKQFPEVPAMYACSITHLKRPRPSDYNDEGRWPYKFSRGNGPGFKRLPRPAFIKNLSDWKDSVDA